MIYSSTSCGDKATNRGTPAHRHKPRHGDATLPAYFHSSPCRLHANTQLELPQLKEYTLITPSSLREIGRKMS